MGFDSCARDWHAPVKRQHNPDGVTFESSIDVDVWRVCNTKAWRVQFATHTKLCASEQSACRPFAFGFDLIVILGGKYHKRVYIKSIGKGLKPG